MNNSATQEQIIDVLRLIYDPEIPINIYDLGLIYDIRIDGLEVKITMTLTSPHCPVAESMPNQVASAVRSLDCVDEVDVEVTWNPPWHPGVLSDEVKLELGIL